MTRGKDRSRYHTATQYYRNVPLTLIVYTESHFARLRAKRFMIGTSGNQNLWIPNKHLDEAGRLLPDTDIDYVIRQAERQGKLRYAGVDDVRWDGPPGIS